MACSEIIWLGGQNIKKNLSFRHPKNKPGVKIINFKIFPLLPLPLILILILTLILILYTSQLKKPNSYFVVDPPILVKTMSIGSQSSILLPSGSMICTNFPYSYSTISSTIVTPFAFKFLTSASMF